VKEIYQKKKDFNEYMGIRVKGKKDENKKKLETRD
jgi:hypothetical protein